MANPINDLIIKFLRLGLKFLKADPADQEAIKELTAERDALKAELAAEKENDPTPAQQSEIESILAEFQEAAPPEPTPEPETEA